ncbi:MAG: hypothetical protein WAV55_10445 [Clostridiaceae bacterium]
MNIRKLKQESTALHRQLNQKNDYKMTDMIMYLRGKDLSSYHIELLRLEFLQMAVKAESDGRAIETQFGYDLREYVNQRVLDLPPMTKEEIAYESFKLCGFAVVLLMGGSIAFDWIFAFIARANGETVSGGWTVTATELFMLLIIVGIALTLGSLFTTHKLEKDPDFFSKGSRNNLMDFIKIYGMTLVIILVGFILIFIFRDQVVFSLPLVVSAIAWLIVALLYIVIRYALNSRIAKLQ